MATQTKANDNRNGDHEVRSQAMAKIMNPKVHVHAITPAQGATFTKRMLKTAAGTPNARG